MYSSGQVGSGWDQRQRTPMHRTNSSGAFPANQRLGSALTSAAPGRSRLDIVGEGGSEQASPATTPPDMAVRQRHNGASLLGGTSQSLPLWLRSDGDSDGAQEGNASLGKPLWLQDDADVGGNHSWGSASSSHIAQSVSAANTQGSCQVSFLGNSAYQPTIASYQAAPRLNSQSQGRRGDVRPPTGQEGRGDGLQC